MPASAGRTPCSPRSSSPASHDLTAPAPPQRRSKALSGLGPGATLVLLARHGETDWNLEHRLQGQDPTVPGLNAKGWEQAAMVGV